MLCIIIQKIYKITNNKYIYPSTLARKPVAKVNKGLEVKGQESTELINSHCVAKTKPSKLTEVNNLWHC